MELLLLEDLPLLQLTVNLQIKGHNKKEFISQMFQLFNNNKQFIEINQLILQFSNIKIKIINPNNYKLILKAVAHLVAGSLFLLFSEYSLFLLS